MGVVYVGVGQTDWLHTGAVGQCGTQLDQRQIVEQRDVSRHVNLNVVRAGDNTRNLETEEMHSDLSVARLGIM